jgi:hypothetical protein
VDPGELVAGEAATLARRRGDPAEAAGRLALSYLDRERDYLAGTVTALSHAEGPLASEATALVLDGSAARLAAERLLDQRRAQRESLDFSLPPNMLQLEPGDLVEIGGAAEGPFEIAEIRDGAARLVTARSLPASHAVTTGIDRPMSKGNRILVRSVPVVVLAHLPPLPADPARSRLAIGAYAEPWPGSVQLVDGLSGIGGVELTRRAFVGQLASTLGPGPAALWDQGNDFEISLLAGHPAAAEPLAVLAGSNRLLVENDAGDWEVLGFAEAEMVGVGRYRLRRLLRGLEGTGPAIGTASAGRRVMLLDARVAALPVEPGWLGETHGFRVYAGSTDNEGVALTIETRAQPALPLPPVHLRARRDASGAIAFSWVRRSRADADGWGIADAPLEHAPERYRLAILNGAQAVRTFDVAAPGASYSAAQQAADFGGLPAGFAFTVAQYSPVLGAGHAARGEFHD